jgi:hypothetical protein
MASRSISRLARLMSAPSNVARINAPLTNVCYLIKCGLLQSNESQYRPIQHTTAMIWYGTGMSIASVVTNIITIINDNGEPFIIILAWHKCQC